MVTSYVYEGDRLVKSVTVSEPVFTGDDMDLLVRVAFPEPRGSHGHLMSDALSRDGDPSNREAKYRWEVGLPSVDFAAQALSNAQDAYKRAYPDADMSPLRWNVKKVKC